MYREKVLRRGSVSHPYLPTMKLIFDTENWIIGFGTYIEHKLSVGDEEVRVYSISLLCVILTWRSFDKKSRKH